MKNYLSKSLLVLITLSLLLSWLGAGFSVAAERITVTDSDGYEVTVELPVKKIVCISSALNELLFALEAGDRVIARDKRSKFPATLKELPVVAGSSYRPQIEAILELQPDLIIADTMLQDDARKKFKSFGIPVIAERASDADNLFNVIRRLAKIVEKEERGEEIIDFIFSYREIIKERVAGLEESEKTRVYWEWREKYKSGSSESLVQPRIEMTGGINICADTEGSYPKVSSEFVWQQDPQVIIRMESRGTPVEKLKESWKEVMTRTGLKETSAVKNDRVHVITWEVHNGLPSIVGDLYYAKWLHPELFVDIEPEQVYAELLKKFFGIEEFKQTVYPAH